MSQALPAPWVAVRTDDGEVRLNLYQPFCALMLPCTQVYYWNEQTDETSWYARGVAVCVHT
jgi:hypothetical protein